MNLIRLLVVILILLVGAAALTQLNPSADKTASPLMKGLENVRSWFDTAPNKITKAVSEKSGDDHETKVYKWKDKKGEWHFSNHPPAKDVASSIKIYRNDVNITQAPELPPEPTEPAEQPSTTIPDTASPLLPITNPEAVKKLIDDAKNIQNLMDNRQKTLEQHVGE